MEGSSINTQELPRGVYPFTLLKAFSLVVPDDYDHANRLDTFVEKHRKWVYCLDANITDANLRSLATTKLIPGSRFVVKVFLINETVAFQECLAFLKGENAILLGTQGASLVFEHARGELPDNSWCVSLDEENALWRDAEDESRVSRIDCYGIYGYDFGLGLYRDGADDGDCLLCFCAAD